MNSINEYVEKILPLSAELLCGVFYTQELIFFYSAFSDISPFSGDLGASRHADSHCEPCAFQCGVRWILLLETPFCKD